MKKIDINAVTIGESLPDGWEKSEPIIDKIALEKMCSYMYQHHCVNEIDKKIIAEIFAKNTV
jgi:hypothetical protein